MRDFDTIFRLNLDLDFNDQTIMIGSCFADNIGNAMKADHFNINVNPFGIVFHPLAIRNVINRAVNNQEYTKQDFFYSDNYYWCYEHHGECADVDLEAYVQKSNAVLKSLNNQIHHAKTVIFTFGTAIGYLVEDKVVANCHKQPKKLFQKKQYSSEELFHDWEKLLIKIFRANPEVQICFSVSPIRHWKDGVVENSQSKSSLIELIHRLKSLSKNIKYIPVYEYVIDVLRDYSYFTKDDIHLQQHVIDNIYSVFVHANLNGDSKKRLKEWQSLKANLKHKLLHPKSDSTGKFLLKLLCQLEEYQSKYDTNLANEICEVKKKIRS